LNYAVLDATHKYFIPQNQECQITLEEDVLIEIFITKPRRARPVRVFEFDCSFFFNE